MEFDYYQIFNTVFAGGAIYAGIRVEIKFIWRFYDQLLGRVEKLEGK